MRDQHAGDVPNKLFVLKEVVEPNKQARHRLASAGKFLRRLHHPGLPRVHQVLNDDKNNRVYLLMEYIAGQDLETLRQQQPEKLFSWSEVMSIMAPIIAVVTYLHHQQPPIIHGDIKLANIIIPGEGSGVVLVDFGMMKAYNPGSTIAASRYCNRAPEQSNGSIDVRTDIYALGATFYTLVTGQLPPDAHSRLTQVHNEAMDPLEPVNSIVPAIPMRISKAIEQAISLDAQHRFSSVEQFWEALWLILAEQPAPVFDKPSVPTDPPAVPTAGLEWAIGQTIEKPLREPPPVVPVLENIEEQEELDVVPVPESIEEQEDQDAEKPPPAVPVLESLEELEDPDATVRLPKLPPVVRLPHSAEGQEDQDAARPLPKLPSVAPAGVKEQMGLNVVNLLPKPSGHVRTPISLRKLGVFFIMFAYLLAWASAQVSCCVHEVILQLFLLPRHPTLQLLRLHLPLFL